MTRRGILSKESQFASNKVPLLRVFGPVGDEELKHHRQGVLFLGSGAVRAKTSSSAISRVDGSDSVCGNSHRQIIGKSSVSIFIQSENWRCELYFSSHISVLRVFWCY